MVSVLIFPAAGVKIRLFWVNEEKEQNARPLTMGWAIVVRWEICGNAYNSIALVYHHSTGGPVHRGRRSKGTIGEILHADKVVATGDDDDGGNAKTVLTSGAWVEMTRN